MNQRCQAFFKLSETDNIVLLCTRTKIATLSKSKLFSNKKRIKANEVMPVNYNLGIDVS